MKIFLGIFISFYFFSSIVSNVQAQSIYDLAVQASHHRAYVENARDTWISGLFLLKSRSADIHVTGLDNFINKPVSEKEKLFKSNPKLQMLSEFVDFPIYLKSLADIGLLNKSLLMEAQNNPNSVKEFFREYHSKNAYINADVIDSFLGFNYQKAESLIDVSKYPHEIYKLWEKKNTQTDYAIIRAGLQFRPPQKGDIVYDLGSGYGRFLFYAASVFPNIQINGVEIVRERTEEVAKIILAKKMTNIKQINQDILKTKYSDGTYFYMFNPFRAIMGQVMEELYRISRTHKIVILSWGNSSEDLIKAKWLKATPVPGPYEKQLFVFESM